MLVDALDSLMKESLYIIDKENHNLSEELIRVSPVDTGAFKRSWSESRRSKYSWSIQNHQEYATILASGRRTVMGKSYGSEQWSDGLAPVLKRADNAIQTKLDKVMR